MTALDQPGAYVARVTRDSYSVLYAAKSKARRIVVTLLYGDVLEFREQGRRARFTVPIANAFKYAVNCAALAGRREKAEKAKAKKVAQRTEREHAKIFREARRESA